MRTISEDRLRELAQGYETWSKTASNRPQIDIDTADALRELLALRTPPSGEVRERAILAARAAGEYCTQGYMAFPAASIVDAVIEALAPALPTIKEPTDGK